MEFRIIDSIFVLSSVCFLNYVFANEMTCSDQQLQFGPSSRDANVKVYISLVNGFNSVLDGSYPRCRLQVTAPRGSTLYQTMRLAEGQHPGKLSFTTTRYPDFMKGNLVQGINRLSNTNTNQILPAWILHDGKTGKPLQEGMDDIFITNGDSFIWRYVGPDLTTRDEVYSGECVGARNYIRASTSVNYAIFYLSVQFWSTTWPLCKLPIVVMGKNSLTLNDTMYLALQQYPSSFMIQTYTNNKIYSINGLNGGSGYDWKAWLSDSELHSPVLTQIKLHDGDHVIWRFVDEDGNTRVRPPSNDVVETNPEDNAASTQRNNTIVYLLCSILYYLYSPH